MKNIRVFLMFSRFSIASVLQSKLGVFIFTAGKLLRFGMFFGFIFFLVTKTKLLKGYSVDQSIIIYLTFNLIDTTSQLLFREVYRFRSLVVAGELDGILIWPINPFLRVLLGGFDPLDAFTLPLYIALTVYYVEKIPHLSFISLFVFVLLFINAMVINAAFHILVLAFGIITTNVDHTIMIYRDLTSTARFPMEIYKEPLRWIITFALPVGLMMSYPSKGLLGLLSIQSIVIAVSGAVISMYVALRTWDFALKRYQSWGG